MRRDDPDVFPVPPCQPLPADPDTLIEILAPLVTDTRLARLRGVAEARTLDVAVVLEGIIDPHNISAVLRSADAFGVQRVHVMPGPHGFTAAHRVARGSHRWLDVTVHDSVHGCIEALHADGYQVLVAAMGGEHTPEGLAQLARVAVVFGNEHRGVTPELRQLADGSYAIPMRGFVESLNVSVAAAITLHAATRGRTPSATPGIAAGILARFLWTSVHDAEGVVRKALAQRSG